MPTTKKTTRKTAPAKAKAKAEAQDETQHEALPPAEDVPEGFETIGAGYAPTWKPGDGAARVLHGPVTGGIREVELTIGRKKQQRRCMEVTSKKTGERFTLWESAALGELFDTIVETGEGPEVWVRFDGHGKKKAGQNPPKLFTVAIKA